MFELSAGDVPIEPSATVAVIRNGEQAALEVLLVQRSDAVRHMGGMWVFPGGKVEAGDGPGAGSTEAAARVAAVRETAEEVGLALGPDELLALSHWTTPPGMKRRFATWFFLAEVDAACRVEVDGGEIARHRWVRPQVVLDEVRDPRHPMRLAPPTFVTLSELAAHADSGAARSALAAIGILHFAPKIVAVEGGSCFLYQGDAGYARADPGRAGPRHRAYMTPARSEYIRHL